MYSQGELYLMHFVALTHDSVDGFLVYGILDFLWNEKDAIPSYIGHSYSD